MRRSRTRPPSSIMAETAPICPAVADAQNESTTSLEKHIVRAGALNAAGPPLFTYAMPIAPPSRRRGRVRRGRPGRRSRSSRLPPGLGSLVAQHPEPGPEARRVQRVHVHPEPFGRRGLSESAMQRPSGRALQAAASATCGTGDEQQAAHRADFVLHDALPVARPRIAERVREAVAGRAAAEQLGGAHRVPDASAHARRIVEHDPRQHAADAPEHALEPLAHALRVLGGEQLRQARVGIRERDSEEAQARARAAQAEVRLPEVGLRLARGPGEVEVPVALRAPFALVVVESLLDEPLAGV